MLRVNYFAAALLAALLLAAPLPASDQIAGISHRLPYIPRLARLLRQMTLEEKISLLAGRDGGETRPIPRLGIPALRVTDGPLGVGWNVKAVCFPCGMAMASTWNPELIYRMGQALAEETRAAGRHVLLAPCVNIVRTPLGGRTFETFSEDPYLAGVIGAACVRGLQSKGIGATVKHFVCNNQEYQRTTISVEIDERALREIYLRAFEYIVRWSDPWLVMGAYNRLRGEYCCASRHLLRDVLKTEWRYPGVVVSDWGAVHDSVNSALAGLDLEMPGPGKYFARPLLDAVKQGQVPESVIDEKVYRILYLLHRAGLLDGSTPPAAAPLNAPEHRKLAQAVAEEGIVLLKNDGRLLPLDINRIKSLAVIGPNADAFRTGGGSARVTPASFVTPLQGLRDYCANRVQIHHHPGCPLMPSLQVVPPEWLRPDQNPQSPPGLRAEYFANPDLQGTPALTRIDPQVDFDWRDGAPAPELPADGFSVRWSGVLIPQISGKCEFGMVSDDGCRIWIDGRLLVDHWMDQWAIPRATTFHFQKGRPYRIQIEYYENRGDAVARLGWRPTRPDSIKEAAALAARCDAAVLFVGLSDAFDTEGSDRRRLDLPGDQDALIQEVAAANPRTIVVLIAGSPVTTESWIDRTPAVLCAWYPGQEGGRAIARVLFGEVNPSGKLPVTFPRRLQDTPAYRNYPGKHDKVHYREGIYVGYRYYDSFNVRPRFPFGHGLSYTTFDYGPLQVERGPSAGGLPVTVTLTVSNSGRRAGAEVVQLYVRDIACRVPRPQKELKAFRKVFLPPARSALVRFRLERDAFSFWDPDRGGWVVEPGYFKILVGSSSRDIRRYTAFRLDSR